MLFPVPLFFRFALLLILSPHPLSSSLALGLLVRIYLGLRVHRSSFPWELPLLVLLQSALPPPFQSSSVGLPSSFVTGTGAKV